ncbi:alpha/beta hydrolase [Novosphingobium album (ex Liu et al. 2023)]|uniref:Alpha/beta hydrolase-fold protein n=1 Tax=Novosphingobium album (ex Liu et al. 2023) TaxID=3031130 RepID=A0ABT5WWT2_9SPHN|nr:alpha/beta hydrolase-fold protein [Novosphingobium album (ex Liu et al. 2023)]MDE8654369.1 alpha/beta hydrolase-fold protein [Novosphingobium album (ex Liu et al. 2023)]
MTPRRLLPVPAALAALPLALSLAMPASAAAPAAEAVVARPITVGEELTWQSRVMGEERKLAIYLPAGYASGQGTFAFLYVIDGGIDQDFLHVSGTTALNTMLGRSQPVIVVGIETRDRQSELTGPTAAADLLKDYPDAGHADRFRRFVREEVMPMVSARYRGNGKRGVIGESLAGLFIVESALREPGLFQRHAAISPSLWWDDARLSREAAELLRGRARAPRLYLNLASEGGAMEQGYDRLVTALAAREPMGNRWCALKRPDLAHSTIYHTVSPEAMQYLFPGDEKPLAGQEPPCAPRAEPAP